MRYGKIRIENGNFIFSKHMMTNYLPCKDILWAYMRREGLDGGAHKQISAMYLVIVTKRRKRYKFDMTEKEIQECIQLLRALNPNITTGFPKGGRIPLQSMPNTRDLGALMTEDGRHILPRRLLRSGALYHISISDQDVLSEDYRLKTVIDFRSPIECEQKPDILLEGVNYHHIPILEEEAVGIEQRSSMLDIILNFKPDSDDYMEKRYAAMVSDRSAVNHYAKFLDVLLHHEEGAVLWHCNAGKDRGGIATVLLLCALGVPMDVIRDDFMKTNLYMEDEFLHMVRLLESKTIVDAKVMEKIRMMFKVKESYLDSLFETIEKEYGTIDKFLRKALCLTPKNIEALRNKYLV